MNAIRSSRSHHVEAGSVTVQAVREHAQAHCGALLAGTLTQFTLTRMRLDL
jgi:hypothetical protein